MTCANVPVDTIYKDIYNISQGETGPDCDLEDVVDYDTLSGIAYKILGDEDYRAAEDPIADVFADTGLQLCSIERDSVLGWCLARYIGEPVVSHMDNVSQKWGKVLRGFYLQVGYSHIYFVHGVGYDWVDADLLGGNGDGSKRKEFEDGITIMADYGKRD